MGRSATATTLTNARLVTPEGVRAGWLRWEGTRISELGTGAAPRATGPVVDAGGRWVLPGLVDIHIHGGKGAAFTAADPERIMTVVGFNRAHGVTTLVGGLVSASPEDTLRQVTALAEVAEAGEIAGIYLEGPYISAAKCGAHDPGLLRDPDLAEFDRVLKAGRGHIRMITVAPELPGALDLIRAAAAEGVVAAVGHTDADYDRTRAAIDAGATVATHVYNQMRPLRHRDPGPIAAVLNDDRVTVELINDGVHVHPGAAQLVFDAAGADRVALVTDAMDATGLGDGEYTLGKLRVRVADGQARLVSTGAIASSTIVLPDAVRRAVHRVGVSVEAAARSASAVPARALALPDVGSLTPGNHADLLILDDDLAPAATVHRGSWIRPL